MMKMNLKMKMKMNHHFLKMCEYTFEYFEKAKNNTQKFNIFLEQFNKTIENISEEGDITLDSFLSKNFSENITNKTEENSTRNFLSNNSSYYEEVAEFNSSQNYFMIYTITNVISALIAIVILILIYFKYNSLNERKLMILFGLTTVFTIFSLILGILNYFNADKLNDFIEKFLDGIIEEYIYGIPKVISNEKNNIKYCQSINNLIILYSIFYNIGMLGGLCAYERESVIMNQLPKNYKKLLPNVEEAD